MGKLTLALAAVVAVAMLSGCAQSSGGAQVAADSSSIATESRPSDLPSALGLVNLWRVSGAPGESDQTWLRLGAGDLQVWRECGYFSGEWGAAGSRFVGSAMMAHSQGCWVENPSVEWLLDVTEFEANDGGYDLKDSEGNVVASLSIDGAPVPSTPDEELVAGPPEITDDVRAHFSTPKLPDGVTPATQVDLQGKWIPAVGTFATDPHVHVYSNGRWATTDGCNRMDGRMLVGAGGTTYFEGGPMTAMACEGAPVQSWLFKGAAMGTTSAGDLVIVDRSGEEVARMVSADGDPVAHQ